MILMNEKNVVTKFKRWQIFFEYEWVFDVLTLTYDLKTKQKILYTKIYIVHLGTT